MVRRTIVIALAAMLCGCGKPALSPNSSASFDPGDVTETLKWIAGLKLGCIEAEPTRNHFVTKEAAEKLAVALKSTAGKKVRWSLRVESVGHDQIQFSPASVPIDLGRSLSKIHDPTIPNEHFPAFALSVGPAFFKDKAKAAKLRPGDRVFVVGTLTAIKENEPDYSKVRGFERWVYNFGVGIDGDVEGY